MRVCEHCGTTQYRTITPGRATDTARRVGSPIEAYAVVKRRLQSAETERLLCILLDSQNAMIGTVRTVSIGSLNTTRSHPREIFRAAIVANAAAIIIAHNHPSGSLEPSRDDVEFTQAISKAGELLGIPLYDHLIVSRRGFISLKERGHM